MRRVAVCSKANKMRGIKHNKAKRCILKGHISEVANHIRMYF